MAQDPDDYYRNCNYCGTLYKATRHNISGFCNDRHRILFYEEKEAKNPRNIAKKREEQEERERRNNTRVETKVIRETVYYTEAEQKALAMQKARREAAEAEANLLRYKSQKAKEDKLDKDNDEAKRMIFLFLKFVVPVFSVFILYLGYDFMGNSFLFDDIQMTTVFILIVAYFAYINWYVFNHK
jgi:hypothetical protein